MTHRHDSGFEGALWRLSAGLGLDDLAAALGTTPGWVRKWSNPTMPYGPTPARMVAADIVAARAGLGTPLFDEYRRQLVAAGALDARTPAGWPLFAAAARPALAAIRAAADRLLALLDAPAGCAEAA